jgi:hypothetical protein
MRLDRNNNILAADKVNGNPLGEQDFPLRLVGSDLKKGEMVGQIAQILSQPPAETIEVPPTPEPSPTPTAAPPTSTVPVGDVALAIIGAVEQEQGMSLAALQAMQTVQISAEHPKKGMQTYTGINLKALLDLAGIKAEATKLVFVASDGYQAELNLADAQACADCMLAFSDDTLLAVMPGMESNFWVKDVAKIEVK